MLHIVHYLKENILFLLVIFTACFTVLEFPVYVLAQEELTDPEIRDAVDDQLLKDLALPVWNIDTVVSQGIVTLTGKVTNILDKERAEKLAATVKGVRGVVNSITVDAPVRPDAEIEKGVERALISDPATEAWEIETKINQGEVTLSGEVDSWQEYHLAAKVAKGVKGVKALTNNIRIAYRSDRSDSEIREDIDGILHWDVFVDDALIEVAVENGKVTLTGAVGSLAEKLEAENDAWVAGVKSVDNRLKVEWWNRDERLRKDKYVARTDAEIEKAVQDVLFLDPRVDSYKIIVASEQGLVTLSGTVDNLKAKQRAAKDAETVVGVWGVNNKIKVRPQNINDSDVVAYIHSALLEDPYVDRYEIRVSASNGVVYLLGAVDSAYEKSRAEDIASRQQGVARVKNYLTVHDASLNIYNPYVDELSSYPYIEPRTNREFVTVKSDWEIKEEIEDEFFWSPFVDGDKINVIVDDGKATLTGTVDTWGERRTATENALEGGALVVDNNLKVRFGPDSYLP